MAKNVKNWNIWHVAGKHTEKQMMQDVPLVFSGWRFLCITEVASRCVQGCNIYGDFSANEAKQKRIHFWCFSNPASTKWYGKHIPLIPTNYRILQGYIVWCVCVCSWCVNPHPLLSHHQPPLLSTTPTHIGNHVSHLESAWLVGQPNSLRTSDRNQTSKGKTTTTTIFFKWLVNLPIGSHWFIKAKTQTIYWFIETNWSTYPPWNKQFASENMPKTQKYKFIFQLSIFRGELLVSGRVPSKKIRPYNEGLWNLIWVGYVRGRRLTSHNMLAWKCCWNT